MRREVQLFLTALMFFTRIPGPAHFEYRPELSGPAAKYLPVIGMLVGVITGSVFWMLHWVFPKDIAVLLSMIAGLLLTGAFHEDGFADVCDGFGGGRTREDVLRIMQDSRVGAFGAMGIALMLLLKFEVLSLIPTGAVPIALIIGHSLSRLAAVSIMQTHRYLRREGEGKSHGVAQPMSGGNFIFALIAGLVPLALISIKVGILVLGVVGVTRFFIGRYFSSRLGGYTGDCLGAAQQVTEIMIYLCVLAAWKFI